MAGLTERAMSLVLNFNPCVAQHELRMRMRGARTFVFLALSAGFCAIAALVTLALAVWGRNISGGDVTETGLGRHAFTALAYTLLTLLVVLLPAYAASAIAFERERQTLEMLRATMLSSADIVTGKLLVVMAYGGLILLVSLPVAAWCLLLGGIGPIEMLETYILLFSVMIAFTALGMFFSALFNRSLGAILTTYAVLIFGGIALPIVYFQIAATLSMASMGSSPSIPDLGPGFAVVVLSVVTAVVFWLVYLLAHFLFDRARRGRLAWSRTLAPALAALALIGVSGYRLIPGAYSFLEHCPMQAVYILHPYFALAAVLYPEIGQGFFSSLGGMVSGTSAPAAAGPGLQFYIVTFACGAFVLTAALFWALTMSSFRRRQ